MVPFLDSTHGLTNPSPREAEAGGSLQMDQGQPGLGVDHYYIVKPCFKKKKNYFTKNNKR